jgi:hypothetical protein
MHGDAKHRSSKTRKPIRNQEILNTKYTKYTKKTGNSEIPKRF